MNAEEIGKILDELGRRVGPAGEYVFELAVRQAVITGWTALVAGLLLVVAGLALAVAETRDSDVVPPILGPVVASFGVVVALFVAIPNILNPEYAALRNLIETIR